MFRSLCVIALIKLHDKNFTMGESAKKLRIFVISFLECTVLTAFMIFGLGNV